MPIPTDPSQVVLPEFNLPITQSPEEIYDAIMSQIEPELVSTQISLLKEKYKDETPEQKEERGQRYIDAHALYDVKYAEFQKLLDGKVHSFKLNAMHSMEAEDKKEEASALEQLESTLTADA